MISTALFLSAGLLTSPVIIQDVQASREAGHLRVEVAADGGIDPDGARTRIEGGTLLIYLEGARVKADNRSWDLADGSGEIRAHRHKFETELVVPLAGNGCTGPVELEGTDTGITALVGCEGRVVADTASVKTKVKADPKAEQRKAEQLKALVELPEAAPEAKAIPEAKVVAKVQPAVEAKAPARVAAVEAKAELLPAAEVKPPEAKPVAAKAVDTAQAETKPTLPAAIVTGDATSTAKVVPGGGLRSIGVPAMLLAILATGAYFFARRRRTISVRRIQILETASLGPKRSLVVARIGDETLILGTSEAGITLLKGNVDATGVAKALASTAAPAATLGELESRGTTAAREASAEADAAAAAFEISQPLEEALADIPEPDGVRPTGRGGFRAIEGGLAGLFSRRGGNQNVDAEDKLHERFEARLQERLSTRRPSRLEESFDDLLEDSLEDQELRQKLAAGMSTRVR